MLFTVSPLMNDITLTISFSKTFTLLKQARLVFTSKAALFDIELIWTENEAVVYTERAATFVTIVCALFRDGLCRPSHEL